MVGRFEVRNGLSVNGEFKLQEAVIRVAGGEAFLDDVGANIGEWTGHLLDTVLPSFPNVVTCNLLLVDPSPQAAQELRRRFSGRPNCVVLEVALGSCESSQPLAADGASPLNRILSTRNSSGGCSTGISWTPEQETVMVATERLSKVVARVFPPEVVVDLVKIDAEGMDFDILQGAHDLLGSDRIRVIQFEYNHRWLDWGYSLRDVFEIAILHHLEVMKVTPHGLIHFRAWHPEVDRFFDANFVLVNPRIINLDNVLTAKFSSRNVLRVTQGAQSSLHPQAKT